MPGAHAQWSPSGSHYWYNHGDGCPARVLLPPVPEEASAAAEEGTRLHDLAEQYLLDNDPEISDEDWEKIGNYCEYVDGLEMENPMGTLLIEEQVLLTPITDEEEAYGTADAVFVTEPMVEVIDLKTGFVRVDPERNCQLMMYGAGVAIELDLHKDTIVRLTIHQDGEARSWDTTAGELYDFAVAVREFVSDAQQYLADTGSPMHVASEKNCQWCPHIIDCEAQAGMRTEIAKSDFAVPEDPDELGRMLGMVGPLQHWIKAIEARGLDTAKAGTAPTGYKLVAGRANRKWIDGAEEKVVALLGDAAYDQKLIGLTAADKLIGKEGMAALTFKPEGKPTLAPEDDKRPAINDAKDDFKEE